MSRAARSGGHALLAITAVALGAAIGGALLGLLVAAGSAVAWRVGNDPARRRRRDFARYRVRRAERRELRFEEEGVSRTMLDELTTLVDRCRRIAPELADHDRLDDLLDLYADVVLTVHRGTIGATALADVGSDVQRAVRIRTVECQARVATLAEREDEIADLIRLYVAVAMTPEVDHPPDDHWLAIRIAWFDASESHPADARVANQLGQEPPGHDSNGDEGDATEQYANGASVVLHGAS